MAAMITEKTVITASMIRGGPANRNGMVRVDANGHVLTSESQAQRLGAEQMREAAAKVAEFAHTHELLDERGDPSPQKIAAAIRDLPLPGEARSYRHLHYATDSDLCADAPATVVVLRPNQPSRNDFSLHLMPLPPVTNLDGVLVGLVSSADAPPVSPACISLHDPSIADLTNAAYDAGYQFKTPPGYADEPEADACATVEAKPSCEK